MTIGENIKRIRVERELTQSELSRFVGISESTIEKYESNKLVPSPNHLNAIAQVLNVNSAVFLNASSDNIAAMHCIFQIFRQFDGYFDSLGNLKFKKLPLSEWRNQWDIYQKELEQAEKIKNEKERADATKNAENKFSYWMDIYPRSNCFNINFDESWNKVKNRINEINTIEKEINN